MCYSYTGSQNDQQMNRYLASDPLVPHLCRFSGGSSHLRSSCHSCSGGHDSSPKGMIHKPDTQWNLDIQLYRYTDIQYIHRFKKKRQTQAGWTTSYSNNLGPLGLRICSSMPWHTAQLLAGRRMSKELRRGEWFTCHWLKTPETGNTKQVHSLVVGMLSANMSCCVVLSWPRVGILTWKKDLSKYVWTVDRHL